MTALYQHVTENRRVVPDLAPDPEPVAPAGARADRAVGAAVRCEGIVKDFEAGGGRVRLLHGIDLALPEGEMALLVGPSGCGKTTLISIIAGILTPTAGEVIVQGENLTRLSGAKKAAFRRRAIGFIFQQYNLLPALTAAENAAVPLLAAKVPEAKAVKAAEAVLERLGMAAHASKLPRQLSGGQQQRVAIARALVHAPSLIVCDEPTAALDAESGRTVMEMLKSVAVGRGRCVIVVTHDNRIFPFGDRIVAMEDGRIGAAPPRH